MTHIHTGALGLIMTLGPSGVPNLWGVTEPGAPALPAPGPIKPCCPPNGGPPVSDPGVGSWPGCNVLGGASGAGTILLRASASCVCEEVGVAWAEPEGELE